MGLITLQEKIDRQPIRDTRWYQAWSLLNRSLCPFLGPDLIDPRDFPELRSASPDVRCQANAQGRSRRGRRLSLGLPSRISLFYD